MDKYISIPYEDYKKISKDSADKESIVQLLNTEFPDDTCQLIAIKSVLGLIEVEDDDTTTPDPSVPTP